MKAETSPPVPGGMKSIRVVLAGGRVLFREELRDLLGRDPNIEIVGEAGDGAQVLPMLEEQYPDILLLDLGLRGDSFAVLERIQSSELRTKTIALADSEHQDEYIQAVKRGVSGIVRKGTDTGLLIKSIRKVTEGETWFDQKTKAAVLREFSSRDDRGPSETDKPAITRRQKEIIAYVAQGLKNKDIGEKLFISEQTVKNHLHNIFQKLGISDRLELAMYAFKHDIRPPQNVEK